MNPYLKIAFDAGAQAAEAELKEKLEKAKKKRLDLNAEVGWKERSTAPGKLSK